MRLLCLALALPLVLSLDGARAQDSMNGAPEPVDSSVDPASLTYDYLVDGNLAQDNPAAKEFKTLQAAYAAVPEGTENHPVVIGIRPNVYQLPGGAARTPSLRITKNYLTLLGLTNDRRTVVLADNRGLMQGADDDGYILDVNATGFTAKNLTIINYCNTDYEYPGDPTKNLKKRSDVITQAVALQTQGDRHVYENVALLSRLDTAFFRTVRSYFKNVYIEGTDDWMGGGQVSYWEDSTLVYAIGHGVMSASNIVFVRCRFEATKGMEFYKAEFRGAERPDALIDCVVPVSRPKAPICWVRGKAPPRPNVYSLTYHTKDADGNPARVQDCNTGPATFTYSRELSEAEVRAFNPWNILRAAPNAAVDDWDPAGVRAAVEKGGEGSQVFRMALNKGSSSIRTGGQGATLSVSVQPTRLESGPISWSSSSDLVSLDRTSGKAIVVTGRNTTNEAQWVPIDAKAADGFYVTAYVYVEPKYVDPPTFTQKPTLEAPERGRVAVQYSLDLGGREDQSLVSWYLTDNPSGRNPREVAVSRGEVPLKSYQLTSGAIGKYVEVAIRPKHNVSDAGPEVRAVLATPIAASDVPSPDVSPNFRNFVPDTSPTIANGQWTVLGTWSVVTGDSIENGYGVRPSTPAYLFYDREGPCGDMQVDLLMSPEKTEGTGFSIPGSPSDTGERNLHSDIYIKFDPRTRTGYALRFWRTTKSAAACMYQWYRIKNGVGSPLDTRQVLSGVFKPNTRMTLRATGATLSVTASNDVDNQTLSLESAMEPNSFGGAGIYWPRGSSTIYSRFAIRYPESSTRP